MDPQTCLFELLEAIEGGDSEAAAEHCENLAEWINKGGFLPTVEPPNRDVWPYTITVAREA